MIRDFALMASSTRSTLAELALCDDAHLGASVKWGGFHVPKCPGPLFGGRGNRQQTWHRMASESKIHLLRICCVAYDGRLGACSAPAAEKAGRGTMPATAHHAQRDGCRGARERRARPDTP